LDLIRFQKQLQLSSWILQLTSKLFSITESVVTYWKSTIFFLLKAAMQSKAKQSKAKHCIVWLHPVNNSYEANTNANNQSTIGLLIESKHPHFEFVMEVCVPTLESVKVSDESLCNQLWHKWWWPSYCFIYWTICLFILLLLLLLFMHQHLSWALTWRFRVSFKALCDGVLKLAIILKII